MNDYLEKETILSKKTSGEDVKLQAFL